MDPNLRALIEQARERFQARDYPAALPLLEAILGQTESFADVHNMRGAILHDQGRFGDALESFQKALKINPAYTEACLNLAVTYNDLGMYNEARAVYARATQGGGETDGQIDPFVKGKLANMHADLADVYGAIYQTSAAIREYRRALELRPDFADIRTSLGKTLREAGRKEEALAELLTAKKQRPRYAPAGVQLGLTYYSLQRTEEAAAEWKAVLASDAENAPAKMYLRLVADAGRKA